MKKIISIVGVFALAILLSGCDYQVSVQPNDNSQNNSQTNLEEEKKQEMVVPNQMEQEEKNYTNKEETKTEEVKSKKDTTAVSIEDIRQAFSKKYPERNYTNHNITIAENRDNKYVEGTIEAPEGGGAHYWATNVNNEWIIVVEAQDSVSCSIFEEYNFPMDMVENNCFTEPEITENIGMYTGLIKKYPDELIAGDNVYYIELSNGIKKDIKVCNKKVSKLNDQIIATANSETETTIYTKTTDNNSLCVNGIALNLGEQNTIYSGIVKEHEGGGFGGYSNYIELQDGSEKQLQTCDKRISGIWSQLMEMVGNNEIVDVHSNPPSDAGVCVSGIVINNL